MKDKRGFTLIELLAVIVILGLLMIIAIPSITKYISESRKKEIIITIGNYLSALQQDVNDMKYTFTGTNTIYAVPIECIALESGGTDPFGKWYPVGMTKWAYALVQYDDTTSSYTYGFTFNDLAGYSLLPTASHKLLASGKQIVTDLGLRRLTTGKATVYSDSWNGFKINESTQIMTLRGIKENADDVRTCQIAQEDNDIDDAIEVYDLIYNNSTSDVNEAKTEGKLLKIEQPATQQTLATTEYRYIGANPKNYIIFNNERWRIVGVFDGRLKIIKDTPLPNTLQWDKNDAVTTNNWLEASLNEYLNTTYFDNLTPESQEQIFANSVYYLGSYDGSYSWDGQGYARDWYQKERANRATAARANYWTGKIALMYASDYGFATGGGTTGRDACLNIALINWDDAAATQCVSDNWLNSQGKKLWLLNHWTETSTEVHGFILNPNNGIDGWEWVANSHNIRPVLYLNSNILLTGDGSSGNEYKIKY